MTRQWYVICAVYKCIHLFNHSFIHSTTATSLQWSPLYNGHLYNGGLSATATSTTTTSLQRPPVYNRVCNGYLSSTVTSLEQPPLYSGHLSRTATSLQRPLLRSPLWKGHACLMAGAWNADLAPVFWKVDKAIRRINRYPADKCRCLIGGERVTCHWSKLNDALGRTKLNDALGKQQLELWTWSRCAPWNRGKFVYRSAWCKKPLK